MSAEPSETFERATSGVRNGRPRLWVRASEPGFSSKGRRMHVDDGRLAAGALACGIDDIDFVGETRGQGVDIWFAIGCGEGIDQVADWFLLTLEAGAVAPRVVASATALAAAGED